MAQDNAIESQRSVTADEVKEVSASNANLGHVRLRHVDTHEIILIPTPSSDPKDPLNWFVCLLSSRTTATRNTPIINIRSQTSEVAIVPCG